MTFKLSGKGLDVSGFNQPAVTATIAVGDRCSGGDIPLRVKGKGSVFP